MENTKKSRVRTEDVFNLMKEMIEESEEGRVGISAPQIAEALNADAPNITYHMNKLVSSNQIGLSDKRGRYNIGIYYLIEDEKETTPDIQKENEETDFEGMDLDELKKVLEAKIKDGSFTEEREEPQDESLDESLIPEETSKDFERDEDSLEERKETVQKEDEEPLLETKPLSLDSRINTFLNKSKGVPAPEKLLTHKDREVLSVMNESIHQNIIYLKNLSEELSTLDNKELIESLIEERNEYLEEVKNLREDNDLLRREISDTKGNFDLDPDRIRLIQQNMIHVLDIYLDQPNHALALSRHEFRDTMSRQINEAFKYILNLEK